MNTLIERYYLLIQSPNASIAYWLKNESQAQALGKIFGLDDPVGSAELFKSALDPLHPIRRAYRKHLLSNQQSKFWTNWNSKVDNQFGIAA